MPAVIRAHTDEHLVAARAVAHCAALARAARAALAASVLVVPVRLSAQFTLPGTPKVAPSADRVQLTALTVSTLRPDLGTSVTVQATLRNVDPNYTINIPWTISVTGPAGSQALASGTASAVAPGASITVGASWRAVAGEHIVSAAADPSNSLREMAPNPLNNARSSGTITPQDVRLLTFAEAAAAGAQFASNVQAPTMCRAVGVFDANEARFFGSQGRGRPLFIADCTTSPQGAPVVTGVRAFPVAFANLTLRNGWSVRSVRVASGGQDGTRSIGSAGGSAVTLPSPGSTSPKAEFSLFADRGSVFEALLEVFIAGPAHLNPLR